MPINENIHKRAISVSLRIGFFALLIVWSFKIIEPFLLIFMWSIIIAVVLFPVYNKLTSLLGNRKKLASTIITLVILTFIILPSILFLDSAVSGLKGFSAQMASGSLQIPKPTEDVKDWAILGERLYSVWLLASTNMMEAISKFAPQLKEFAPKVFSAALGFSVALLQIIISIIIAGILLPKANASGKVAKSIFTTLIGKQAESFVELSAAIIRSVVQGVLGVAFIQAFLGGIGIWAIGIPAAGLWALIILFVAILQLPPILILGPLAIYVFSMAETTPAIIFLVWSIIVSASDAMLKPLFLGRGVDVPMLAILLGAIGGMMLSGILGLFVGAVVLAISYKIFEALLIHDIPVTKDNEQIEK